MKYFTSIVMMTFLLLTNLTSCATEEPILTPTTKESGTLVKPDVDSSDSKQTQYLVSVSSLQDRH